MFKKDYCICVSPNWSNEDVVAFKKILDEYGAVIKMTDISKREELPESDNGIIFIFRTTGKKFRSMIEKMKELGHSKPSHVYDCYVW